MFDLLIRARYGVFAALVVTLGLLLAGGRRVAYEQSLTAFFPDGDPAVVAYQRASGLFGSDNLVFVAYDDPELLTPAGMDRLAELAGAVAPGRIAAVTSVDSLEATPAFWRIDDELIRIEGLPSFLRTGAVAVAKGLVRGLDPKSAGLSIGSEIRQAKDDGARAALRETITTHPLLRGTLVSGSGASTSLVVHLRAMEDQDVKATIAALRDAADAFASRHGLGRPALVGPPVLLADGFTAIEQDGRRLAVAGMLLIALVTLAATGSPWWALVPILCGWTVWLAAEHVLAGLDLKLALSGGPIVAQIIVLTMPAASHLAIHFRDHLRRHPDRRAAARETLAAVSRPIAWCAVTGAVGYAALVTSNVVPVRQFGAVLAVCTLAASGLTLALSPLAMRPPIRLERPVRPGTRSRSGRAVDRLIGAVARRPLAVVLVMGGVALALASGIPRLEYESNYIHAFRSDSRVVRDYNFVESRLGGIGLISVVVPVPEGPPTSATLAKFEDLRKEIERTTPGETVTSVLSLSRVLDPDGRIAALGATAADRALATKLELIDASPQGALLGSFWNREEDFARVLVRLPEQQSAPIKERTFERSLAAARAGFGAESSLTGLSYLLTQTTRGVMATSWSTFAWALGGIIVMLVLAYRSVALAVLALLPSLLAVGLVIGLMGWIGVKLDLATALVSSVALGLSVDDTFHCLLQYRRHRERGGSPARALRASFAVSGPGVLLSSLAVALGFAVLWFSPFAPFRNFGVMVGIATLGSSIGNLVLLPAFLAMGSGSGSGSGRIGPRRVSRPGAVQAGPGGS